MPKTLLALLALVSLLSLGAAAPEPVDCPSGDALAFHASEQLASLPRWHEDGDEPDLSRDRRIGHIGTGIALAADLATCTGAWHDDPECHVAWPRSRKVELVAALVSMGWWESRYALHVHEGRCRVRLGECDGGRARSPWQIQTSALVSDVEWYDMLGADEEPTAIAARCAARILAVGLDRCGSLEGAIGSYATGKTCKWSGAAERTRHTRRMQAALTRRLRCAHDGGADGCGDTE